MPFRVLHIVTYMGRGGLETFLMNVYRNIDREKIQFDFLVHREFRADYDDEIEALGGKIYRLPRLNPFSPGYHRALHAFFREHPEYRVVHCHQDCLSGIPLAAAKKAKVPVRIAHSHNASQDKNLKYILKRYYMKKIPGTATQFFACSQAAGEWMFPGQSVTVVNNGIETKRFAFNPEARAEVREELGFRDELVLGHVGRFSPQKNHEFLIDIFKEVHDRCPEAVLLLVGEGPLEAQIRKKAKDLGLTDAVRFLGLRADVDRLYQAMDVFVMPSHYEGLSLCTVEAQTSGLPCFFSGNISQECKMADCAEFVSLAESADIWAERILTGMTRKRRDRRDEVTAAGYDIQATAAMLQNLYLNHGLQETK